MNERISVSEIETKGDSQFNINRLTLAFKNHKQETAYQDYTFHETLKAIRAFHLLALAIYLFFGVMDILLVDDLAPGLLWIRFAIVSPLLLLGFAFTYHPAYIRFHRLEIHLVAFLIESSLFYISFFIGPPMDHLYLDGLVVIILFSYIFIRTRFLWITTVNLSALLLFFYLNSTQPVIWQEHILSDTMRFILTNILGITICYTYEYASRRHYLLFEMLKKAQQTSETAKQQLEINVQERTAELSLANEQLKKEIEEHQETYKKLLIERASLEQRVSERTAELGLANNEMVRALRMRNEFLANMSHELRTPLNAILGMSEILLKRAQGKLDQTGMHHLNTIQDSGNKLLSLINNILDLAKLESARMELVCEDVSLDMVCEASLQSIKKAADEKNISLQFTKNQTCGQIRADAVRLKQMLVNLLDNAVKFSSEGGEIGLDVCCVRNSEVVQLTVWDKGIGIKPEQFDRLFQPFVQVDSSLTRVYEGTGMGLVLVARLAEMHGGSVGIESNGIPGQGSRFSIWLPSHSYQYCIARNTSPQKFTFDGCKSLFSRALIIDEDSADSQHLQSMLQQMNIETHQCFAQKPEDLKEANNADIILLGLLEPGQAGWQLLQHLKSDPVTHQKPIILFSSINEQVQKLGMGTDAFLVKPVTPIKLDRTLRRISRTMKIRTKTDAGQTLYTVLLVEDNEITLDFLTDALLSEHEDYRPVIARSGMEAIERVREEKPGAIIISAQTKDIDEVYAMAHLKTINDLKNTPIIAITAIDSTVEKERCHAAGAIDCLRKPVDIRKLVMLIEAARVS